MTGEAIFNLTYAKIKSSFHYGDEKRLTDYAHHTLEFDAGSRYNTEVTGVDCHVKDIMVVFYCTTCSNVFIKKF